MARPLVQVFNATGDEVAAVRSAKLPGVFLSPVRPDVVHFVHSNVAKNRRQAYAVNSKAGHDCSAASWGTGRAVSRIPRVNGGGTHRAGQGAFGNMCRGGRMFAPTKTWRKWHRKVNQKQRRYAVTSALAASGLTPLVMARGHRIEQVAEIPLVLSDELESVKKTSAAEALLKRHGAGAEIERVRNSRQIRRGKGKMRNRRYVQRTGPLVVYANDNGVSRAFRNIPGVDTCHVDRLNILQLAPGGHLGRFIVWSESAFKRLDALYGGPNRLATIKKGFRTPRPIMSNPDITRIINSDEVQSAVRPAVKQKKYLPHKKNPLKNLNVMLKLNPYIKSARRAQLKSEAARVARKAAVAEQRAAGNARTLTPEQRAERKARKARSKAYYANNFAERTTSS